jgi:hypothetical protein
MKFSTFQCECHLLLAEFPNVICFPASGVSQKQLRYWFMHEVQPHYQLLDGISGPLHSPKRNNPVQFYWGSEEARILGL